jgi:hypothetical protein
MGEGLMVGIGEEAEERTWEIIIIFETTTVRYFFCYVFPTPPNSKSKTTTVRFEF